MKTITKYHLLILFISALTVRGIYFYQFQNNPFFDHVPEAWDQTTYDKGAKAFANGNLLAADPDISNKFSPLYQYFLGIIYVLFGHNLAIVWGIQFLIGSVSTLLIYQISNHYFRPCISFMAALIFTFYGVNWMYEGALYRASMITFLGLASCYSLIQFSKNPNKFYMFLSAIFLSLVMQSRVNNFTLVPFALFYLLKTGFWKDAKKRIFFYCFITVFILASIPLLLQSYYIHGHFVLYDNTGPETLLQSNTLDYPGREWIQTDGFVAYQKKYPMKFLPVTRFIIKSAWENPFLFFQLYLKKIYYYFNNYEVPSSFNYYIFQEFSPVLKWVSIQFAWIGSLGIVGCVLLKRERNNWTLLHAFFFANLLMFLPFYVTSRFRLPVVPFLAIFSAYSLWILFQKIKQKNYSSLSILVICIVFLNFVQKTDPLPEGKIRIIDYSNVGSAFINNSYKKDDFKSYNYYKRAWNLSRTLKPEQRKSMILLKFFSNYYIKEAEKYRQINNLNKELEALEKAVYFDHSSATTHYNYALALYNKLRLKEAFFHNLQAIEINEDLYSAQLLIGLIYNDSLQMPLWAYYHWKKAYDLMPESEEKKTLFTQIENLQDQIMLQNPCFQSYSNNFSKNILSILQNKAEPFFIIQPHLTLPDMFLKWSSSEVEQYLISLYQRLILFSENNDALIYYQLGMLYWKKIEDESVAFFYLKKSWDRGIKFQNFADVLNAMQERLEIQDIL